MMKLLLFFLLAAGVSGTAPTIKQRDYSFYYNSDSHYGLVVGG